VRFYGLRHLRDVAAAQDLAQEVLLLTIEQLRAGRVRQPDQIGSFILGTSRVMATSRRRLGRRRQALDMRFGGVSAVEPAPDYPGLDQARLERCLGALGERDRAVLVMSFYAERSSQQIGRTLGVPAGAVRVARHRALSRLRQCVLGEDVP
jgi:RNA polymerase sigma-70 factor (ECF subfamily)